MSMDPALVSSLGWNFIDLHDFWSSLPLQPRDTHDMHTPWMVPLPELAAFSSSSHAVTMPPGSMLGQRVSSPTSHMHCTSWPNPISVSKTNFHRPWLWTSFLLSISAASWASPSRTHHHPNPEQKEDSRVIFVIL